MENDKCFGLHMDFEDGSNPIIYYDLTSEELAETILKWTKNFVLKPNKNQFIISSRFSHILNLHAIPKQKPSYF